MKTEQILKILKVVAWIVFIGLCIRTGALLISFIVSLFIHSQGAQDMYMGLNLFELLEFSLWHYLVMASLIILLSGLKAYLFLWVIKILSNISFSHPFSEHVANLISRMSGIALQIGITAFMANTYAKWLMKNPIHFNYDGGGTEFVFLAGILFVIAAIFKRGMELQSENELTI